MSLHTNNHGQQAPPTSRPPLIPPHLTWPLIVVLLLVTSVCYSMAIVFAARSDGGAQVVENYYEKAVAWDSTSQLARNSEAAGWRVSLEYAPSTASQAGSNLEILFMDKEGQPITGLVGHINAFRPQHTQAVSTLILMDDTTRSGIYQHPFPDAAAGIWDFEINAKLDSFQFRKIIRKELVF